MKALLSRIVMFLNLLKDSLIHLVILHSSEQLNRHFMDSDGLSKKTTDNAISIAKKEKKLGEMK